MAEGYEVVYAVRSQRKGETWFKHFTAKAFYRLIYGITDVNIPSIPVTFRLLDRTVVDTLRQMREHHRFMRGLSVWIGFRQIGIEYVREERYAGETKYPFQKMLQVSPWTASPPFPICPLQLQCIGFIIAGLACWAFSPPSSCACRAARPSSGRRRPWSPCCSWAASS